MPAGGTKLPSFRYDGDYHKPLRSRRRSTATSWLYQTTEEGRLDLEMFSLLGAESASLLIDDPRQANPRSRELATNPRTTIPVGENYAMVGPIEVLMPSSICNLLRFQAMEG